MVNYTLECIASCGFGMEINAFNDTKSVFRQMVNESTGKGKNQALRMLRFIMLASFPKLTKLLDLNVFPKKPLIFFADVIRNAIQCRESSGERRNDLVDVFNDALKKGQKNLMDENGAIEDQFEKDAQISNDTWKTTQKRKEDCQEDEDFELVLISNAVVLFFAGFDTTSSALTVCLGFLALDLDLQVNNNP